MMELFEMLGAVYGWCWVERLEMRQRFEHKEGLTVVHQDWYAFREYSWNFLYWPARRKKFSPWILTWKPLIILAGYMSRNRGLHWDRKGKIRRN